MDLKSDSNSEKKKKAKGNKVNRINELKQSLASCHWISQHSIPRKGKTGANSASTATHFWLISFGVTYPVLIPITSDERVTQ